MGRDSARRGQRPHGSAETVLVVDDVGEVRKFVGAILQKKGYAVIEAANGPDALQICEMHPGLIHLLLTDVSMPGMNGPELFRQATALRPGLPVVYMSGDTDPGFGIPFLQKPFTPTELIDKVGAVLQKGPGND